MPVVILGGRAVSPVNYKWIKRLGNETTSPKEKCLNDINKRKLEWFTHMMFNPTGILKSMR